MPSSPEVDLAMERGEVQARGGASLAGMLQERGDWVRDKKVIALVQVGAEREKDYPDVPLMHELAKTTEQRQMLNLVSSPPALGRPFFTTPGRAGRARGGAAQGLRRDHEGRGLPGRGQAARA